MVTCCEWCQSQNIKDGESQVFWELPDGSGAIEITETPTVFCLECEMIYQPEGIVKKIEEQLMLINTKNLAKQVNYQQLMETPRILKRNYFDIT
ncbi:YokU family protein [Bacillus massilinigeriensis]|uniref:YokU family protein n=1 Tax=Bacillus massilionigeriensis TaxID=1805475 RepID=UPI00096AEE4F|nr:YokU family protein [Bacillus massilionigeriensis]